MEKGKEMKMKESAIIKNVKMKGNGKQCLDHVLSFTVPLTVD